MGSHSEVQAEKKASTDVGISFVQSSELPKPIDKIEPNFPSNNGSMSNTDKLPSTGELVGSIIVVLFGCTVILIVLGIFLVRNIFLNNTYRR